MNGEVHINVDSTDDERREALTEAMRLLAARSAEDDAETYKAELSRVYRSFFDGLESIAALDPDELDTLMSRVSALIDALAATAWAVGIAAQEIDKIRADEEISPEDYPINKENLLDLVEKVLERRTHGGGDAA